MTITQTAILLIRVVSISFFADAFIVLSAVPEAIFDIHSSRIDYIISEHEFALIIRLVRSFFYLVTGACFLIFSRPIGKLFAKGLESISRD
jgi:hypothetical protein